MTTPQRVEKTFFTLEAVQKGRHISRKATDRRTMVLRGGFSWKAIKPHKMRFQQKLGSTAVLLILSDLYARNNPYCVLQLR